MNLCSINSFPDSSDIIPAEYSSHHFLCCKSYMGRSSSPVDVESTEFSVIVQLSKNNVFQWSTNYF